MHPFLNIADRAARLAGKTILDGLHRLDRLRMQQKQDNRGVVTEIDLKAEKIIISTIQEAYPNHGIFAEASQLTVINTLGLLIRSTEPVTMSMIFHILRSQLLLKTTKKTALNMPLSMTPYVKKPLLPHEGKVLI
jgi:3'-phosphoadenosine 5'-phosphosulfate (PAPS) 3'-phosphatase